MTNLGERIYQLRTDNNMSQGDLADRLDVSRQTVSKWENNQSVPEMEKLIALSEIFSVSVDYIVKGKETKPSEQVFVKVKEDNTEDIKRYNERIIKKYVGLVLAVLGFAVSLILLMTPYMIVSVITALVALLGILIYKDLKHPYLISAWVLYAVFTVFCTFATSISILGVFDIYMYKNIGVYWDHLLWSWGVLAVLIALIVCTVKAARGKK